MKRESMCDTCLKPGNCCVSLFLTGRGFQGAMSHEAAEHKLLREGLPFRPRAYDEDHHRWTFWCPNLRADGRCGDYENRPALCRMYQPGEDGLCVHHWTEEIPLVFDEWKVEL
jgi:Fe-S-cluster containining protein